MKFTRTDFNSLVAYFMLLISVHMITVAKQSQLMHNIVVYLFIYLVILFIHLIPNMFRQVTMPLSI
jgi:hypothetical protein